MKRIEREQDQWDPCCWGIIRWECKKDPGRDQEPLRETQAAWPPPGSQQFTIGSGPRESQQRLLRSQPTHLSSFHVELWRHFGRSHTLRSPTPLRFSPEDRCSSILSFKILIILKAQLKCHFFSKSNLNPSQNESPSSLLLPRSGLVSGVALFLPPVFTAKSNTP